MKSIATILAIGLIALVLAGAKKTMAPEFFPMPATGGVALPFSSAVKVGNTLYVSGQIGNVPGTLKLAPGGIRGEARQAMENIRSIVEAHGGSMEGVVKCTAFMADIQEWAAFNEVYREFFTSHFPARSALAASGLASGARAEVECIAVVP